MDKSLGEVHSSVLIKPNSTFLKRLLTFSGPAFMVSVGYMDPGNWATDLAGGARFGYKLIFVILLANLMAILFQTLSARLGIVAGRDLAQACRDHYPKPVNYALWIVCEIAIAACDLAEVLGSAIGLYLLFKIPLIWGVAITTFDVLLLMGLMALGIRKMEAFILSLVLTIGICFGIEMLLSKPLVAEIVTGFAPSTLSGDSLFIALGIIGATVMPHNLYLHSALVQSRNIERTRNGIAEANKFNLIDSVVALNGAFFVNSAILVLSASVFFKSGWTEVASIIDAHSLLSPLLGSSIAPIAFGIALLAAGQSSTITGTFAGQIVMEGFIGLKLRPWMRRLMTRLIAIIPALIVINAYGDSSIDSLLVLSQVILSLQLPFAIIPLLHFTSSKNKMSEFASKNYVKILAWFSASLIIFFNLKFIFDLIIENFSSPEIIGIIVKYLLVPVSFILLPLLIYVIAEPVFRKGKIEALKKYKPITKLEIAVGEKLPYTKIGIALEGNYKKDKQIFDGAIPILKSLNPNIFLIHCVQSVTGRFIGEDVGDEDANKMNEYLSSFANKLSSEGFLVNTCISGGEPKDEIVRLAKKEKLSLIVVGSHGHKIISDIIYGSTIDNVRHRLRLPVLAIPVKE